MPEAKLLTSIDFFPERFSIMQFATSTPRVFLITICAFSLPAGKLYSKLASRDEGFGNGPLNTNLSSSSPTRLMRKSMVAFALTGLLKVELSKNSYVIEVVPVCVSE